MKFYSGLQETKEEYEIRLKIILERIQEKRGLIRDCYIAARRKSTTKESKSFLIDYAIPGLRQELRDCKRGYDRIKSKRNESMRRAS